MCSEITKEAYYRRMAQRYRVLAAGSRDREMAEGWRAIANECDKLAEGKSMQRHPMQQQIKQNET